MAVRIMPRKKKKQPTCPRLGKQQKENMKERERSEKVKRKFT